MTGALFHLHCNVVSNWPAGRVCSSSVFLLMQDEKKRRLKVSFALVFFCERCATPPPRWNRSSHPLSAILSLPLVSSRQVVSHSVPAALGHLDSYSPWSDPASYTNRHGEMLLCRAAFRVKPCEGPSWPALRPPKSPKRTVKSCRPTSWNSTTSGGWGGGQRNGVIAFARSLRLV